MTDIELVIKIPEDSYKATCNGCMLPPDVENVVQGIKNGTPLPKGHGDLIDRNKIVFDYWSVDGYVCVGKKNIFSMPVVVPADKEGD